MKKLKQIIAEYESLTGLSIEDVKDIGSPFSDYVTKISNAYITKRIDEETCESLLDEVVRTAFFKQKVIMDDYQRDGIVFERLHCIDLTLLKAESKWNLEMTLKKYK
ncbi:MAG: hypothetical protein KKA79_09045 [Nanoarchaeota archaeon]|nr:hypothetical protein [Nanoarchaeota archaeon]MCG2717936.1 hypothetical protein [Nanoarchaeota archaeon]